MLNDLFRSLLGLLRKHAGSLLGLARKGLNAIRALFGGARGLLGPLIKRALSFLLGKLSPAMSSVRARAKSSFASLMRMAEGVLKGEAPKPRTEADEPETPMERSEVEGTAEATAPEPSKAVNDPLETGQPAVSLVEEPAPAVEEPATVPTDEQADVPPIDGREPRSQRLPCGRPASIRPAADSSDAARSDLTLLAPVLKRALVRALNRDGEPRRDRQARLHAAS